MEARYVEYVQAREKAGQPALPFDQWVKTMAKIKPELAEKYPHYYRKVPDRVDYLDVYRVLDTFGIQRSCVQHAIKKLLCGGQRGAKNEVQDLKEARDSLNRAIEMIEEERPVDAQ